MQPYLLPFPMCMRGFVIWHLLVIWRILVCRIMAHSSFNEFLIWSSFPTENINLNLSIMISHGPRKFIDRWSLYINFFIGGLYVHFSLYEAHKNRDHFKSLYLYIQVFLYRQQTDNIFYIIVTCNKYNSITFV